MAGVYARSRFVPKPRTTAPAPRVRPQRTVGDGQNPADIVCVRIRAHVWAAGRRVQHTVTCYNDRFGEVLLSLDPAAELAERAKLLAATFEQFSGIDWDYSHQVLLGDDGAAVWALPDVDEIGFLPDEDETFGRLKPPVYRAAPLNHFRTERAA